MYFTSDTITNSAQHGYLISPTLPSVSTAAAGLSSTRWDENVNKKQNTA